jgi:hypothetical protein
MDLAYSSENSMIICKHEALSSNPSAAKKKRKKLSKI